MRIVQSVEPLSLRFRGIQIDNTPMHELPLEKISAPTLIVSARDDLFNTLPGSPIFVASKIHGAKLVVYETGGHLLVGRGEEIAKKIENVSSSQAWYRHRFHRGSPQLNA